MGDFAIIVQNSILYVAGNEGLAKFNKAGYMARIPKLVHSDGSLDLPGLIDILLDVFPEDRASEIADSAMAKYLEMPEDEPVKPAVGADVEHVPAARAEAPAEPDANDVYEDNLAKYLETDASDVRDLINEARRIRTAMGKAPPPKISIPRVHVPEEHPQETQKPADVQPVQDNLRFEPITPPVVSAQPAGIELSPELLDAEINSFIAGRKSYTSIDIMDFIRYLKDKGYHFQENTVLEKVYIWLEERKNRERNQIMVDIQAFLETTPWPSENEVTAYIERKINAGTMCEGDEIKRMILVEMIRKH
jgi:hypothetical protein